MKNTFVLSIINIRVFLTLSIVLVAGYVYGQQVLIEAEFFENRGGWVSDHQAFEKIKSAYLMAHGLGRTVEDAETTIHFTSAGKYHVYVSTYNWTSPWYQGEGPGAFQLIVDGKALPKTLGTKGNKWEWQYAGEVEVKEKTKIALHDLTGFNGRVDAIYFNMREQAPPSDYIRADHLRKKLLMLNEPNRTANVDLVVIGGGIAGCATALTAARYGLKVILVDNLPWLGGNNALGVKACGLMCENLYPELGNITCQVIGGKISDKNNRESYFIKKSGTGYFNSFENIPDFSDYYEPNSGLLNGFTKLSDKEKNTVTTSEKDQVNNEIERRNVSALREKLLRDSGVLIYKNIQAFDVKVNNDNIVYVIGKSLLTGEEYRFEGTMFADCTGDGVVGYLAGADYLTGRESKEYAGEPNAPDQKDSKTMGITMNWYAYPRENSGTFPQVDQLPWAMQCSDNYYIDGSQGAWWWETGLEYDNALEAELVRDNFLRAVYGNWAYLKNNIAKYNNYRLDYLNHIGMKRESRRIIGDLVLTERDLKEEIAYPDASFTTTWTMDLHYAKPDNSKMFPGWEWITYCTNEKEIWIKPYHVPYRCLYSKDINNLFIGGRNMSVTHQALGSVRVQATLGMAGEVIGMAAKICNDYKVTPRGVYKSYLDELINYMKEGAPLK